MNKPKKRPLLTFIKKVLGNPIIRGTLKSLPFGNLAYEVAEQIKHATNPETKGGKLPHSPVSILFQLVFLALIIYAFFTHQITIDDLMRYVIPDDFKQFGTLPTDSIQ